ncbi:MAG: bifunctional phosphopantothenoylcysteine decarboxylase/phosphopantothenate--cysteine ligase CoaBC [Oscillospiraceae bacterium]|nr:bifunctional phosphopantothenoylcysteine decarboxylase/phosphopantothenate--cysteine ligase CoaBC [Oscillospiraceae bacterium]
MLQGKTVLLGVTGGIAAYKAAALASALVKLHACVEVVMTQNATEFIAPLTFEQLTGNRTMVDTFDRNFVHQVEHISLAQRTDLVIIAPATANVCAKLAHGLADDMLTTTVLACKCPKLIAPAMNTNMYENPVTQDNLQILQKYGWQVITPASGRLACGAVGSGKLPEPEELVQYILREIAMPHDLQGKTVLVTAGATREALDPVRYLTNHSSGKMGCAIAEAAMLRGARVILVCGAVSAKLPSFVQVVSVVSAQDMFEAVAQYAPEADYIFKAAAVADYTPADYSRDKMKKKDGELSIPLKRTTDILAWLGENRRAGQVICGFSMETKDMLENSRAKLEKKKVDMICANNLKQAGAGFGVDTNIITIITKDDTQELPLQSKQSAAHAILTKAAKL